MSQFYYADYEKVVESAQKRSNSVRVGFFKLVDDGDQALVRFDIADLNQLDFASIHTVSTPTRRFMKVSCLNEIGSFDDKCPLCHAAETDTSIGKASRKLFVKMLVRYFNKQTNSWDPELPVIWERPAGFVRELKNLMRDYGTLTDLIFKITRNGKRGDRGTTYTVNPASEKIFKPDTISNDFSAFDNFDISRHSYWIKSAEEMTEYLKTGDFPEADHDSGTAVQSAAVQPSPKVTPIQPSSPYGQPNKQADADRFGDVMPQNADMPNAAVPAYADATAAAKPQEAEAKPTVRKFGNFDFGGF